MYVYRPLDNLVVGIIAGSFRCVWSRALYLLYPWRAVLGWAGLRWAVLRCAVMGWAAVIYLLVYLFIFVLICLMSIYLLVSRSTPPLPLKLTV